MTARSEATVFRILVLFVTIPLVELVLLIEIGQRIGALATVALIVATGILGASLARYQGLEALTRLRAESAAGQIPTAPLLDGVLILLAGAVLLTPGVLTDAAGFLCLIPACRRWLRRAILRRLERAMRDGRMGVTVNVGAADRPFGRRPMKNVTPRHPNDRVSGHDKS